MKRPLGLWILLSAGVVWLNTQDVHGVRATALIFGKSSTTSTTTSTTTASSEEKSDSEEEDKTEGSAEAPSNGTKPVLTGIPQIDYIYDPNLPKELNGYNLSDYPFYERVPENITFKCDGLHDGFYASVLHKCQVYHHCLFGIRYDFLCANYTAFDQTLFNCNFVNKVDCKNSKNFWSRNDDLYKTASTPPPPPVVYNFYTQAPPIYPAAVGAPRRNPLLRRIPPPNPPPTVPTESGAAPTQVENRNEQPVAVGREDIPLEPVAPRRKPLRPRPAYDYYEDYDEPQWYRRKRPRPRPYYDDEEYEYYDDRYLRRGEGRRRRPYDRPMRRYKGKRKEYADEDELYDDERDDDRYDDDRYVDDEEPRKRKGSRGGGSSTTRNNSRRQPPRMPNPAKSNRKPADDYYDEEYDDNVNRRSHTQSSKHRNSNRRPSNDYEEEDNRKNRKDTSDETKTIVRPTSGTIFDRPRMAPKINLPVPKNVADKYSYKAMSSKTKETVDSEEEENEKSPKPETRDVVTTMRGNFKRPYMARRPIAANSNEAKTSTRKTKPVEVEESDDVSDEENDEIQEGKANARQTTVRVKIPVSEEVPSRDSNRQQDQERRGFSRVAMFKTRHSLSTPLAKEAEDPEDFVEIDDSINEAKK